MYSSQVVGALASSGVVHAIIDFQRCVSHTPLHARHDGCVRSKCVLTDKAIRYDEQIAASAGETCASQLRAITRQSEAQLSFIRNRYNMNAPHFTAADTLYFLGRARSGYRPRMAPDNHSMLPCLFVQQLTWELPKCSTDM